MIHCIDCFRTVYTGKPTQSIILYTFMSSSMISPIVRPLNQKTSETFNNILVGNDIILASTLSSGVLERLWPGYKGENVCFLHQDAVTPVSIDLAIYFYYFNKTIIALALDGYEKIDSQRDAYHLISIACSSNNCLVGSFSNNDGRQRKRHFKI